ncbi:MAG: conjugal transfer protein TraF [Elusimicrobia bacterium]|nr:conjugal transfer protein TraF [Elusimicrobiota bacterium]
MKIEMKNQKMKSFLNLSVLLLVTGYWLLVTDVYASFMDAGCGARCEGMGGAFTAVSDDANAVNANPGGLARISGPEITALYGRMHMGLTDDSQIGRGYFGLVYPLKKYLPGVMGLSWEETRLTDAYAETSIALAYSRKVRKNIFAGLSLKHLRKSYSSDIYTSADPLFSSGYGKSSIALDVGGVYRFSPKYSVGLVVKNVNQPDIGIASKDPVPAHIKAGFAYFAASNIFSADLGIRDGSFTASAGAERWLYKKLALRLGLLGGSDSRRQFNMGFGTRYSSFLMDYSFTLPIGGIADTSGSHRISFSVRFGAETPEAGDVDDFESLKKQLSETVKAMNTAQERALAQERQIMELEKRVRSQAEIMKSFADKQKQDYAHVIMPEVSTDTSKAESAAPEGGRAAESVLELKKELEKSRAEIEFFKNRMGSLEEKMTKKPGKPMDKVEEPSALQKLPDGRKIYVVQDGDTLQSIAEKAYGNSSKWIDIYKANSKNVGRGGEVKPGQILTIP